MLPARIAAVTCEPSDEPTERDERVEAGGLAGLARSTPRRRSGWASPRRPARCRRTSRRESTAPRARCRARRRACQAEGGDDPAEAERDLAAEPRRRSCPETGPATSMISAPGSISRPAPRGAGGEAVAGRLRRLGELRDEDERAEHPEAGQQRRDVRHQRPAGAASVRDVGQRLGGAALRRATHTARTARPDGGQAEDRGSRPAPDVGLARSRRAAETRPTASSDARRGRRRGPGERTRRLGDEQLGRDRRRPPPRRRRARRSSGRRRGRRAARRSTRPEAAADAGIAEIRPMLAAHALARELVADDPEAQREDAAADALQHAAGDDDAERVADAARRRSRPRTAPAR